MEKTFSSLAELQAEIQFLKVQQFKQEENLKHQFSSPGTILKTLGGFFKTESGTHRSFMHDLMSQDIITNVSRVIIPLLLNGVIFKKSGFIVKTLVTFLSQKAAKQVNSHALSSVLDKITGIFKHKEDGTAPRTARMKDYGIPPDSETY